MADWMDLGGSFLSAGTNLLGGFLQSNAQQAMNSANISAKIQQDQFNAAQVAQQNANNMNFTNLTNQQNRDFIWQTNMQNEAFQRETNAWNAAQVQKQMDFQERLSGSAYQRAMEDMRKAGLNPILAYQQGGASSMPGASPVGIAPKNVPPQYQAPRGEAYVGAPPPRQDAATQFGAAVGGVATSAIDALQKMATIGKTEAESKNLSAQFDQIVATTAKTEEERKNLITLRDKVRTEIENNTAMHTILLHNGVSAEMAAHIAIIDAAQASKYGGKYMPSNVYDRLMRIIQKKLEDNPPPWVQKPGSSEAPAYDPNIHGLPSTE